MALSTRQKLEVDLARFFKQWCGMTLEEVHKDLENSDDEQVAYIYKQARTNYANEYEWRYNPQ